MKILHILEDYSINSGGIRTVVKSLHEKLENYGHSSYIIAADKEKEDDIYVVSCRSKTWLYSKQWQKEILEICEQKKIDILHLHGVWLYPQYCAAKIALRHNIPFAITPHGMYEPRIWKKGKVKKNIYFNIVSKNIFSQAAIMHAVTPRERKNLRKLFPDIKLYEIPNLIKYASINTNTEVKNNEKYILYLGRLHTIKGIDLLIKAFAKINPTSCKLKIAGPASKYQSTLKNLVKTLKIESKVEFTGLVKGKNKAKLFQNAFVFVAPSYSEVIGMVNLEAAMYKTPVITTHQTGLNEAWNNNGGILINPNEDELYAAIKKVMNWSMEERNANGEKLYNFVLKNYSLEKKFSDWEKLYKTVLISQNKT